MRHSPRSAIGIIAVLLACAGQMVQAHPSPEHSLRELTQHLEERPGDSGLMLARARLLRKMGRVPQAEQALLELELLSPGNPGVALERARIAYDRDQEIAPARTIAIEVTKAHPEYAPAWEFLGQLQRKAGDRDGAIVSYRKNLDLGGETRTGNFADLADMLADRKAQGDREEAIQVLDLGISKSGDLIGFHLMAADLEASLQRYDAAARRLDRLAARFRPRPDWSKRKGDIFMEARRPAEAHAAYDAAIAMFRALPAERRQVPEAVAMGKSLQEALEKARHAGAAR